MGFRVIFCANGKHFGAGGACPVLNRNGIPGCGLCADYTAVLRSSAGAVCGLLLGLCGAAPAVLGPDRCASIVMLHFRISNLISLTNYFY